jgi:hypothetical protein
LIHQRFLYTICSFFLFFFSFSSLTTYTHHIIPRLLVSCKVGQLGGDDETSDTGRGESSQDTGDQSRDGKTGNVTTTSGGELAENTNLDTQRTDVAETAEGVGGDELGAGGEAVVLRGGIVGGEVGEGVVLVLFCVSICRVLL